MSGMNPTLLQKQLKDNANDLQEYFKDIKLWGEEMKRKEEAMKNQDDNKDEVPLPRNKIAKVKKQKDKIEVNAKKEKPIAKLPKEYTFWEKFDVEAECEKIDKEKSDSDSDLTDEEDEAMIDLAMEEKEKGNRFVKSGRYEDAIKCYTNAIDSYSYDPVFYANRALCHLKLKHFKEAEVDCTTALQIDKEYVKALHRRAIAREALQQYTEAVNDLEMVLQIEPKNKESQLLLEKLKKKDGIEKHEPTFQRPVSKFTLSRQKGSDMKTPSVIKEEITPAIKQNVYERINPLDKQQPKKSLTSNNKEPQPSTSNANETPKQSEIKWPSGDNVKIIKSVTKTPKNRSKLPLKRVQIFDVDLKSNYKLEAKPVKVDTNVLAQPRPENAINNKILMDDFKVVEKKQPETMQMNQFENIDCNVDVSKEDFKDLNLPPPSTSVQFYQNWKNLNDAKRFLYLRQINPSQYASIFKDSLESRVFSEIIHILGSLFVQKNVPVFEYLYGLTKVKRFGALVMFKSSKDKMELLKLIDAMRTDSRHSKDEVDYLIKRYEM